MQIQSLKIVNIRRFPSYGIQDFNSRLNIIVGPNANGKTTLLEALSIATNLQSFKTKRSAELISVGETQASISAELLKPAASKVVIGLDANKKQIKIDGQTVGSRGKYPFLGTSVSFIPDDLYLIKGSPERRRDFLDHLGLSLDPTYAQVLSKFERTLRQRNRLLKMIKDSGGRAAEETLWTEEFIQAALPLYKNRIRHALLLNDKASTIYRQLFAVSEAVQIKYLPQFESTDLNDLEMEFRKRLEDRRIAERAVGYSLVGPQKDDLHVFIDGKEARIFASQGQIRGIVIALKVSQLELSKLHRASEPILLLDDIISELDDQRVRALVQYLAVYPGQLFVTTAEVNKVTTLHSQFSGFKLVNLNEKKENLRPSFQSENEALISL